MTKKLLIRPTTFVLALLPLAGLAGCVENQDGADDMQKRQNAALKDPFSYDPNSGAGVPVNRTGPPPDPALKPERDDFNSEWKNFWNP